MIASGLFKIAQNIVHVFWHDEPVTQTLIIVILGFAGLGFVVAELPLVWASLSLGRARVRVKRALKRHSQPTGVGEFSAELQEKVNAALSHGRLKPFWGYFLRDWRDGESVTAAGGCSPVRLSSVVSIDDLARPGASRNIAGAMPGMLVALGILGTFIGLTQGLEHVESEGAMRSAVPKATVVAPSGARTSNAKLSSQDVSLPPSAEPAGPAAASADRVVASSEQAEKLQRNVSDLIQGLGIAFRTSLWGILLSILFIFTDRALLGSLERKLLDLDALVEKAFPYLLPGRMAGTAARVQREQVAGMQQALTDLAVELGNKFHAAIRDEMVPAVGAINEAVRSVAETTAAEHADAISHVVKELLDSLREGVNTPLIQLSEAVDKTRVAQEGTLRALDQTAKRMDESTSAHLALIDKVRETTQSLHEVSGTLRASGVEFAAVVSRLQETSGKLGDASASLGESQRAVEESMSTLRSGLADLKSTLEEERKLAAQTMAEMREAMREISAGLADNLLRALGQVDELLSAALNRLSGTIKESDETLDRLGAPLAALEKEIAEIAAAVGQTKSLMEQAGDHFPKLVGALNDACGQLRDALAAPIGTLREVTDQLRAAENEAAQGAAQVMQRLDTLTQTIGQLSSDGIRSDMGEVISLLRSMAAASSNPAPPESPSRAAAASPPPLPSAATPTTAASRTPDPTPGTQSADEEFPPPARETLVGHSETKESRPASTDKKPAGADEPSKASRGLFRRFFKS